MDEWPTVDDVLRYDAFRRYSVRDEDGRAVAEWWMFEDGGLLFTDLQVLPVGHAIQHGFVCADRALWKALATARHAPTYIQWTLGEELAAVPLLWSDPAVVADALRDAIEVQRATRKKTSSDPTKKSIKEPTKKKEKRAPAPAPGVVKENYAKGESVHVLYGSSWWDGRIENVVGDGTYLISYDGYDADWNETVGADRLRGKTGESAPPNNANNE